MIDWTENELHTVSAEMKKAGLPSFDEFTEQIQFQDVIRQFASVQREGHFACPRCGNHRMADNPIRNALSRAADIQICDECGMDEAIRDFTGDPLPNREWDIMKNPQNYIR